MLYLSEYRAKLVWKAAPKKALHLVYGWANTKSKEALPRAADVLCQPQGHGNAALCLVLLAGIPEMMPGAWAHVSSFLELGSDGYRATVSAWFFAF